MEAYKVIIFSIVAVLCTTSCGEYVSKSKYNQLQSEYNSVKESLNMTQNDYLKQAEALEKIFSDMSYVSRSAVELRSDIENGGARLTQVEKIENSIIDIKKQLDKLNELEQSNERFRKVVSSLRKTIKEKEAEISALRSEIELKTAQIERQETTIAEQTSTIENQNQTINQQRETLRKQVREQAALLFEAGAEFEKLADDSPEVSLKKNKTKVGNWKDQMYQNALLYYTKAQQYGYPNAQVAILRVKNKMKQA